jgi:hypothetical protein
MNNQIDIKTCTEAELYKLKISKMQSSFMLAGEISMIDAEINNREKLASEVAAPKPSSKKQ